VLVGNGDQGVEFPQPGIQIEGIGSKEESSDNANRLEQRKPVG
jgi:hypothetical protein